MYDGLSQGQRVLVALGDVADCVEAIFIGYELRLVAGCYLVIEAVVRMILGEQPEDDDSLLYVDLAAVEIVGDFA